MKRDMRLIVLKSAKELGNKINKHLVNSIDKLDDYCISIDEIRFANGEGKIKIQESVRDKDLYVISDVGNYDLTYISHGKEHFYGPDEHFSDIKRVIAATSNHADRISLIMPLLYESRQDKRKGRESLDCAVGLQELERLGISNLITFDAHNPAVSNAVPTMSFENFYPTSAILESIFDNDIIKKGKNKNNVLVLAPDFGAMERARYYAEMIGCDVGAFYKRRDYSTVVDGKNPVVEHIYLGPNIKNKDVLIVDDMIASGVSVLEVADLAKQKGAKKVIICATFALFTEGIEKINDAYNKEIFDYIYSTNLTYVPDAIKNKCWYVDVDCSTLVAKIISSLNHGDSLEPIHNANFETYKMLRKKKK